MKIEIDARRIGEFCRRWRITELALFGSALRDDFHPDSDVDVLVTFAPEARWGWGEMDRMQEELKEVFGREVDLVEKETVRNPFIRHHILHNHRIVYAAA